MFSIASIIAIAVNKQVLPERICILIGCAFGESSLEVAEKDSATALSQQSPFRLMLCTSSCFAMISRKSLLVYCTPWSLKLRHLRVGFRHPLPKCPARGLAVVAVGEGHDLAGTRRHSTVQSQCLFLRRHTNDQTSSSSRTSLALATNRISLTVGQAQEFF